MKKNNNQKASIANDIKIFSLIFGLVLIIFVIINIFVFKTVANYYTKDTDYPKERAYLASALRINTMYIYPISKKFWYDCSLTKPFYYIRNKLFDFGYSHFPKYEIEKEFWWNAIKFSEYNDLVHGKMVRNQVDWGLEEYPPIPVRIKVNKLKEWDKELYHHIDSFLYGKITSKTDKSMSKYKLVIFVELLRTYYDSDTTLKSNLEEIRQIKAGIKKDVGIYPSAEQVIDYEQLYKKYLAMLEYSKNHEKESYDYYYSKPDFYLNGELFVHYLSLNIVQSRLYRNKLQCDDPFLKIYIDSQKKLREADDSNKITGLLSMDVGSAASTVYPFIAYKCKDAAFMKDYVNYILSIQYDKKLNTLEAIKDRELKDYKNSKQYDRLEQLKSIGIN